MNLVLQPAKSSLCGQACIAMIAGISLREAMAGFKGHHKGTNGTHILKALDHFKIRRGFFMRATWKNEPNTSKTAIVRIHWTNGGSHWSVLHEGFIYDPLQAEPYSYKKHTLTHSVTSWIPVFPGEGQ